MLALDVDASKPPTYPFNNSIFKEQNKTPQTQNTQHSRTSGVSATVHPEFNPQRLRHSRHNPRFRVHRLGEAVSRPRGKNPQEENRRRSHIFCKSRIRYKILGSACCPTQVTLRRSKIIAAIAGSHAVCIRRAFGINRTASRPSTKPA